MEEKYTTNWSVQIIGMIFQTHFRDESINKDYRELFFGKFKKYSMLFL